MIRYLWVGDPHVQAHDLRDAQALAEYVLDVGFRTQANALILAGDLYDTHAIIHAEVQWFWTQFFTRAAAVFPEIFVVKGNHDAPGTAGTRACALWAHNWQKRVNVVMDGPMFAGGRVVFLPYTADASQLVAWAKDAAESSSIVFCHQTFDGSVYDNGFYAGDGVDPALVPQDLVISGHIHAPQAFGKVWYPGAPRWRHLSDANTERAIWTLDIEAGKVVGKQAYSTGATCRRIWRFEDRPDAPAPLQAFDAKDTVHVEIVGPRAWIEARQALWEGRARVQTVCTDAGTDVVVRESEGLSRAFGKWVDAFEAPLGTDRNTLRQMARERVHGAL